jgi:DNA-directed RNA polymerase specialized sigma24 family protein
MDYSTTMRCDAILAWVRSEAGRGAAARLVRKYGLTEEPLDLVSIASEKITASLSRRTERIPSVDTNEDATRYAYRTMSNLAIDLGRRRRNESSAIFSIAAIAPTTIGT